MGVEVDINTAGNSSKAAETLPASQPEVAPPSTVTKDSSEHNQPAQSSAAPATHNAAVLVQSPPIKNVQPSATTVNAQSTQPVAVTPAPIEARVDQTQPSSTAATAGRNQTPPYQAGVVQVSKSSSKGLRYHRKRDIPLINESLITRRKAFRYRDEAAYFRQRGLKYADKARYYPNRAKHYNSLSESYLGQSKWYREQSDKLIAESDRKRAKEHATRFGVSEGIYARKRIHRNRIRHLLGLHTYGPY